MTFVSDPEGGDNSTVNSQIGDDDRRMTTIQADIRTVTPSPYSDEKAPLSRLQLTARQAGRTFTAIGVGIVWSAWLAALIASVVTAFLPAMLWLTRLQRRICNHERSWCGRVTGTATDQPYRPLSGSRLQRGRTVITDPATWRDSLWMGWHCVVDSVLSAISALLLLSAAFYFSYPLLYAVTPAPVLRDPFGPWSHLSSVAQACAVVPVGALCVLLWYVTVYPLARAQAGIGRRLLAPAG
jgi:hypothetical protein